MKPPPESLRLVVQAPNTPENVATFQKLHQLINATFAPLPPQSIVKVEIVTALSVLMNTAKPSKKTKP